MSTRNFCVRMFCAAFAAAGLAGAAHAQQKEIKVGVIFDYTGPLAAGGSIASGLGTKAAIDMINERGGVEGYKIKATYADAQSKADVAINEMTRLLDQEKVDVVMGLFSSAHCVPIAQQVDSRKVTLTDKRQLARWVADYGEDSDFVRVRVRGRFPRAGTMQFIGGDLVEAAMARLPDPAAERRQPLVMGVDVARFGDDSSVMVLRKGRNARAWRIERHRNLDLMTLASRVTASTMSRLRAPSDATAASIGA